MSFNISKFKASMDRFGGPARTDLFEVRISPPLWYQKLTDEKVSDFTMREFSLFCSGVSFPGVDINTGTFDYIGQLSRAVPNSVTNPGPVTCTFYCDSDHNTVRFFHRWMREVMNFSSAGGMFGEDGTDDGMGRLKGESGLRDNYKCDMEIRHYSTQSDPGVYYAANLETAFPIKVSPIALSWDAATTPATISVDFAFEDYKFSADKAGSTGARSTRGGGLLDLLGDLAGFADTVRGTLKAGKPRSIQDAVNRLQRLGNAVDNVSDNIPNG